LKKERVVIDDKYSYEQKLADQKYLEENCHKYCLIAYNEKDVGTLFPIKQIEQSIFFLKKMSKSRKERGFKSSCKVLNDFFASEFNPTLPNAGKRLSDYTKALNIWFSCQVIDSNASIKPLEPTQINEYLGILQ